MPLCVRRLEHGELQWGGLGELLFSFVLEGCLHFTLFCFFSHSSVIHHFFASSHFLNQRSNLFSYKLALREYQFEGFWVDKGLNQRTKTNVLWCRFVKKLMTTITSHLLFCNIHFEARTLLKIKEGFSQCCHRRTNFWFPKEPISDQFLKAPCFFVMWRTLI